MTCRDTAIEKITQLPKESVSKILIFMAGMEAEHSIDEEAKKIDQLLKQTTHNPTKNQTA